MGEPARRPPTGVVHGRRCAQCGAELIWRPAQRAVERAKQGKGSAILAAIEASPPADGLGNLYVTADWYRIVSESDLWLLAPSARRTFHRFHTCSAGGTEGGRVASARPEAASADAPSDVAEGI